MKEQIVNYVWEPLVGLLLEPANPTQVEQILSNAKECLHWIDTYHNGDTSCCVTSYRLEQYLGIRYCMGPHITYKFIKEMISFLELSIKLGLTGGCIFETTGIRCDSDMYAYERPLVSCMTRPRGKLYTKDDPLVEGFREPDGGKVLHRSVLDRKTPKKYRIDHGDGNGFCDTSYQELVKLTK